MFPPQRPAYDALSRLSVRDQSVPWECVLCMCVILVCHLGIVDEIRLSIKLVSINLVISKFC